MSKVEREYKGLKQRPHFGGILKKENSLFIKIDLIVVYLLRKA